MKAPAQPGVLPAPKSMVGMVHVAALPGTPHNADPVPEIATRAAEEARLLERAGLDAVMIENMHDRPYLLREVGPEVVAGMTAVAAEVRRAIQLPLGVQVLAGANHAALAVAHATGGAFVRAEGFVFGHLADEGLMHRADAAPLLRYRRQIGAGRIAVWADVKKKHASHAISADVDLGETARAAEFFGADAVIVTGTATGRPAAPGDVRQVKKAVDIPVAIGSGLSPDNLAEYWNQADIFIIGSWFKHDGLWSNPPDPKRLQRLTEAAADLRG